MADPDRPGLLDGGVRWGVFALGRAQFLGSAGNLMLDDPVVALVGDPSGRGYWLMGADGGFLAYGNAPYLGAASDSPPAPLNQRITSSSTETTATSSPCLS